MAVSCPQQAGVYADNFLNYRLFDIAARLEDSLPSDGIVQHAVYPPTSVGTVDVNQLLTGPLPDRVEEVITIVNSPHVKFTAGVLGSTFGPDDNLRCRLRVSKIRLGATRAEAHDLQCGADTGWDPDMFFYGKTPEAQSYKEYSVQKDDSDYKHYGFEWQDCNGT